jgi:hypothetical protein
MQPLQARALASLVLRGYRQLEKKLLIKGISKFEKQDSPEHLAMDCMSSVRFLATRAANTESSSNLF